MSNSDFTTTIVVENSAAEAYKAINNVRGWWQGEIEGNTDKLNEEFTYRMKDIHFSKQKLVELIPYKKIVWLVTESNLSFTQDKSEWTGTSIVFEISENNGDSDKERTKIRFTHLGLFPGNECFDACSNAWSQLIQESLYSLITIGVGKNVFE